jgi:hypothetical protein
MSPTKPTADPELEIWERVFVPDPQQLSAEQAQYLLEVRFPQADLDRINALSAKAREGTLTPEEKAELDRYVHVGHLLSILKAKVRGKIREATDHP